MGVEPIGTVVQFASAADYSATTRPPSAREVRNQELKPQIQLIWNQNFRVYGANEVRAELRREGRPAALWNGRWGELGVCAVRSGGGLDAPPWVPTRLPGWRTRSLPLTGGSPEPSLGCRYDLYGDPLQLCLSRLRG